MDAASNSSNCQLLSADLKFTHTVSVTKQYYPPNHMITKGTVLKRTDDGTINPLLINF